MKIVAFRVLAIAAGVLALDVWTKRWATAVLSIREPMPVLGDFVRLTYTRNSGVAFGLGADLPFPYYVFSIVAVVAIVFLFASGRARGKVRQTALALILGGAIGNLIDRLASGSVVDFIEIGWGRFRWPVFNVADSAVTIGVLLFGLSLSSSREKDHAEGPDASPAGPHEPDSRALGAGAESGGASRSLPRGGADGPVS